MDPIDPVETYEYDPRCAEETISRPPAHQAQGPDAAEASRRLATMILNWNPDCLSLGAGMMGQVRALALQILGAPQSM